MDEALSGGWAAQVARWRGWQAPPRRPSDDDATDATETARSQEPVALAAADRGLVTPAPAAAELAPLLATATALPPLDWAPLQALALGDARRRQALAAQEAEEDALLVLLLLEEV